MGRAPCCDKANVKKGPWPPEEDAKLKDFIEKFGTGGNWISFPQKAGLKRCGKSCRLRWLNYLRPNIKHGEFSDDEDRIICTLYASIGSRWSIIAAQLPGRTDNDIKNYWNTKLKKKLQAIQGKYTNYSSHFSGTQFHDSLSSLSNLYNSFYSQATKSLTMESNYYNYNPQNQEGTLDISQNNYPVKESNMLVFGGNEASCSSSEGSFTKQDEMRFVSNGFEENQKFTLYYNDKGSNGIQNNVDPFMSSFLDQKATVDGNMGSSIGIQYDVEEVKNLVISSDNGCNYNDNSLVFNDENKTIDKGMYYYY